MASVHILNQLNRFQMARKITSGDLEFRFRSNRLSLDFIATVGERDHRNIERLRSLEDLDRWAREAGLHKEGFVIKEDDFAAALDLREALARILVRHRAKTAADGDDVAKVNAAAKKPPFRPELRPDGLSRVWKTDALVPSLLSTVARDFIDLVSDPDSRARIKRCADPTCNMFFLDNTRANNRIWCATDGKGCGNKAKKRAFVRRHSHASDQPAAI